MPAAHESKYTLEMLTTFERYNQYFVFNSAVLIKK